MKSKKDKTEVLKPNMTAIIICVAVFLLLFGAGLYKLLHLEDNYINHLSNIYHHDELELDTRLLYGKKMIN